MASSGAAQLSIRLSQVGVKRANRWILREIDWSVPAGTCCAILGPNGAGKSTLTRILAAHLWPTTGQCEVIDQRFGEVSLPELRHSIRLVQSAGPYDVDAELSARQVVLTGFFGTIGLYDSTNGPMERRADELLQQVGLGDVAKQPYATLSSGERVRALIARALAARPKLLLLDEPTAGLDLLAREQVLATVQALFVSHSAAPNQGHQAAAPPTVVLITHHVEELPPATSQVLLLGNGQVAASGPPAEVLRSDIMSRTYGVPLEVRHVHGRWSVHVHPGAWETLLRGSARAKEI